MERHAQGDQILLTLYSDDRLVSRLLYEKYSCQRSCSSFSQWHVLFTNESETGLIEVVFSHGDKLQYDKTEAKGPEHAYSGEGTIFMPIPRILSKNTKVCSLKGRPSGEGKAFYRNGTFVEGKFTEDLAYKISSYKKKVEAKNDYIGNLSLFLAKRKEMLHISLIEGKKRGHLSLKKGKRTHG